MPHPFFSKPVRTIDQAIDDLFAEATRRGSQDTYLRALSLLQYSQTRKVTRA